MLQQVWRNASRRPPTFESDKEANTFAVTLDWREIPDAYDKHWKERLGVRLTADQALVLNLALDPAGITEQQAASGTGLSLDEAQEVLRYLVRQVHIEKQVDRFHLQDHLRELVQ